MRWLAPEKLHLTLVFLGSTEASEVPRIASALADVATGRSPFDVATGNAGGRVSGSRGGVAWLRLAHGGPELARLSRDVDEALDSRTYDRVHVPRPHLTVARGVTEGALADLGAATREIRIAWTVDRIARLPESHRAGWIALRGAVFRRACAAARHMTGGWHFQQSRSPRLPGLSPSARRLTYPPERG